MKSPRDAHRCTAGFTLVEVVLAAAILSVALVGGMGALTESVLLRSTVSYDVEMTYSLAHDIRNLALSLPRTAGDGIPATQASEVLVLDDLDGATFNPPITATLQLRDGAASWAQSVVLTQVALDDPTRAATAADGEAVMYELSVTVLDGITIIGQYKWWITP